MKKTVISALLCSLLMSCAMFDRHKELNKLATTSSAPTKPNFDYGISGGDKWGLVQAFSNQGKTYVQFMDIARVNPTFLSDNGQELAHTVNGMYAVLEGDITSFVVVSDFGRAVIYKIGIPSAYVEGLKQSAKTTTNLNIPAQATAAIRAASKVEPNQPEFIKDTLFTVRELAKSQHATIVAFNQNSPSSSNSGQINKRIQSFAEVLAKPNQSLLHVYFDDMSNVFTPSDEVSEALIQASTMSDVVLLRGFTDAKANTTISKNLAFYRALNVKRYLLAHGVDKDKVKMKNTYQSSGGFIADNKISEGKSLNRRVDVYFSFRPNEITI